MNQASKYAVELYHVSLVIRESIEYAIKKDNYDINVFKRNKDMITKLTSENTPFDNLLKQNGENGNKIRENVASFIELLYADDARAIRVEDEKVIVDYAFSTQIFDYVVGLHEVLNDILNGFAKKAKEEGNLEDFIENLLIEDDLYYRSLVSLHLTNEIHNLFLEFNKTMKEANGKENPQSSFVLQELNKVIGYYNFVQNHSTIKDEKYVNAQKDTTHVLEIMSGKSTPHEGKDTRREIIELREEWTMLTRSSGIFWNEKFNYVINLLRKDEKEKVN